MRLIRVLFVDRTNAKVDRSSYILYVSIGYSIPNSNKELAKSKQFTSIHISNDGRSWGALFSRVLSPEPPLQPCLLATNHFRSSYHYEITTLRPRSHSLHLERDVLILLHQLPTMSTRQLNQKSRKIIIIYINWGIYITDNQFL